MRTIGNARVRTSALRLALLTTTLAALRGAPPARAEGTTVGILVLKEHGVGSQALAQPYIDRFVALAAVQNGWGEAKGQYFTNRSAAEAFIQEQKPHYAILSLAAFLALRGRYRFDVIGEAEVSLAGGRQYSLISKSAKDLAGCKGKVLASDHIDDARFIERVVARGQFTLADFTPVQTQRPLQTIKKLVNDEATCALVDDTQLAELSHIEGVEGVRAVWTSAKLPPMTVVALPAAPAAERKRFQENLKKVCDAERQSACGEVGIVSLTAAGAKNYEAVVAAYGK